MRIKYFIRLLFEMVQVLRNFIWCLLHGIKPDPTWRFYGLPIIKAAGKGSSIRIGQRFVAVSSMDNNSWGIAHKVSIRTVAPEARIFIGDNVGVSGCAITCHESITIGSNVLIGSGVLIADHDSHPVEFQDRLSGEPCRTSPVVIEDNVFIGARCIILKGVHIGRGSVVGAGSVVRGDVPELSVVAGNPAVVVKRLSI